MGDWAGLVIARAIFGRAMSYPSGIRETPAAQPNDPNFLCFHYKVREGKEGPQLEELLCFSVSPDEPSWAGPIPVGPCLGPLTSGYSDLLCVSRSGRSSRQRGTSGARAGGLIGAALRVAVWRQSFVVPRGSQPPRNHKRRPRRLPSAAACSGPLPAAVRGGASALASRLSSQRSPSRASTTTANRRWVAFEIGRGDTPTAKDAAAPQPDGRPSPQRADRQIAADESPSPHRYAHPTIGAPPPRLAATSGANPLQPTNPPSNDDHDPNHARAPTALRPLSQVDPCPKPYAHDWAACQCGHQGERAARRNLRVVPYRSVACPYAKKRLPCPDGDQCLNSHNLFEYWLHPERCVGWVAAWGLRGGGAACVVGCAWLLTWGC